MSFTTEKVAVNPYTGEECLLERAAVWCVDTRRGDIYVVTFEHKDVLVQLLDGGIVDPITSVMNIEMDVMVDREDNRVIALPTGDGGWSRCKRLRD
jgi:hypothetical protein